MCHLTDLLQKVINNENRRRRRHEMEADMKDEELMVIVHLIEKNEAEKERELSEVPALGECTQPSLIIFDQETIDKVNRIRRLDGKDQVEKDLMRSWGYYMEKKPENKGKAEKGGLLDGYEAEDINQDGGFELRSEYIARKRKEAKLEVLENERLLERKKMKESNENEWIEKSSSFSCWVEEEVLEFENKTNEIENSTIIERERKRRKRKIGGDHTYWLKMINERIEYVRILNRMQLMTTRERVFEVLRDDILTSLQSKEEREKELDALLSTK